jgi:hypothetical protein
MEWNDMDVSATSARRGSPEGEIKAESTLASIHLKMKS